MAVVINSSNKPGRRNGFIDFLWKHKRLTQDSIVSSRDSNFCSERYAASKDIYCRELVASGSQLDIAIQPSATLSTLACDTPPSDCAASNSGLPLRPFASFAVSPFYG